MQNSSSKIIEPLHFSLTRNQLLVFYGHLADFHEENCLPVLSESEIKRVEKYLLPCDRKRDIVSKAVLKQLLGDFLGIAAEEVIFACTPNGKPFLTQYPDLKFNSSHTGEMFVIAFTFGNEIGIDVENKHRNPALSKLEKYVFTPDELSCFEELHPSLKNEYLISSWTQKEAMLKASGDGLTKAMNSFELRSARKEGWFLENFTLAENYCGTVAVQAKVEAVKYIPVSSFQLKSQKAS